MRHVLQVSRHLRTQPEALTNAPIWISDALLRETFDCFSKGCRRHGSHAPGPLEARRRATRRKNTSIAYNGAHAAPSDVAGLFGQGKPGVWWKQPQSGEDAMLQRRPGELHNPDLPPQVQEEAISSRRILSWFDNPPAPPVPQVRGEDFRPQAMENRLLSATELKAREVVFQEKLLHARNLDDVRSLVQDQNFESSQAFVFFTLALQHVLQSGWGLESVKDFVLDPVLNPPGARPFRVLGNALKGEWLHESARTRLFDIIRQCFSLGIATPEEIKHFTRGIPRFKVPRESDLVRLDDDSTIHDYYQKILSAIEKSKVLSTRDLGHQFMYTLFKDVSTRAFAPGAAHLLWKLRHYSKQSEEDLASSMLVRLSSYGLQDESVAVHDTEVGQFLAVLPAEILPSVLVKVTHWLVSSQIDGATETHLRITRWHDLLAGLSDRKVQRIFASKESWSECLLGPGSLNAREPLLVITCWVAVSLSKRLRQADEQLRKLDIGEVFKEAELKSNHGDTRDVLAQFLRTLQTLPLSNTGLLLRRLRFVTDEYLVIHNEHFVIRATKKDLLRRFSVLQHDQDYDHFRNHFNDTLVDLAESVNKDLSSFLHVSRYFIERDASAFPIIVRIVKHNLALHNALSQSQPERLARYRAGYEAPHQLAIEQKSSTDEAQQHSTSVGRGMEALKAMLSRSTHRSRQSHELDHRKVLDLMNHLAISFATSPVITPRQALRRVYWCFEMLHRYGAPIESPITRALWHAGITRQGQNGTAKTILKWIIQQIRAVEGDNVANMLLRSAGFRQKIEEQFDDLAWVGKDMPIDDTDDKVTGEIQKLEFIDYEATSDISEKLVIQRPTQPQRWRKEDIVMSKPVFRAVHRPVQHARRAQSRERRRGSAVTTKEMDTTKSNMGMMRLHLQRD